MAKFFDGLGRLVDTESASIQPKGSLTQENPIILTEPIDKPLTIMQNVDRVAEEEAKPQPVKPAKPSRKKTNQVAAIEGAEDEDDEL